ncbi:methionine adenosyltransferase [Candidatus Woesearchaeota archaeon]|nr:methionine adenosyltransferase [Candidatus Woesearchaeota archaeon]
MSRKKLWASECVTEGHPDKVADQIADTILDYCLGIDPDSRFAMDMVIKNDKFMIGGEITSKAIVDQAIVRELIRSKLEDIGYNAKDKKDIEEMGISSNHFDLELLLTMQSPDISQGVTETSDKEQGAGDQGIMFGYACNETPSFMPLDYEIARDLCLQLSKARKEGIMSYLRPDGKSQVTIEYEDDKPSRLVSLVIAASHNDSITQLKVQSDIIYYVMSPIVAKYAKLIDTFNQNSWHINGTGKFIVCGPKGDSGEVGRKIVVDQYGSRSPVGGGAFSGKDPSKVDRSAAYYARYAAKNIVAAGLADRCNVFVAYCIGKSKPEALNIETYGTAKIPEERIEELLRKHFSFKPKDIIAELDLRRPIYAKTAAYGHFGRDDPDFTWERLDKAEILRSEGFEKKIYDKLFCLP